MTASPSELIDKHIAGLGDSRGRLMVRLRTVVKDAEPSLQEEWKWETPVFVACGNVCALGAFKESVKLNLFKGTSLPDPQGLFNGGLEAKALDVAEGDAVDEAGIQDLVRAAVAQNTAKK